MATTTNQGFLKHTQASGTAFAKVLRSLTNDLDSLLRGRNKESHTLADAGKAGLNGGAADETVVAHIINVDDGESASVLLDASNDAAKIQSQTNSTFGTTEDNDTTTNVYWDGDNSQFELNNETGGEKTYDVTFEGQ